MRDSRDNIDWLQPVNLDAPLNEGLRYWGLAAGPLFGGNRLWDACGQFHGSMVGNAAFSTASPVPGFGSIALDGTGDYVNLGRVRAMEITGDISCFCWLKTTTVGGPAEIVSAINTGAFTGWSLENNGGMIALWDGAAFRTASTYINDGNWNYIGFATRGAIVELFVNGRMVSSQATSSPRSGTANGSDVNLGGWQAFSRANSGNMSDVRFYNRGLSTAEACALYDAARNGWRDELRRLVSRRAATYEPSLSPVAGTASLSFGSVAALGGTGAIAAAPAMAFGAAASLGGTGALAGATSLTFASASTLSGTSAITGTASLTFASTAALTGFGALAAAPGLTFAATASASATGDLAGSGAVSFGSSATISGAGALAGSSDLTFSESAAVGGAGAMAGSTALTFGSDAALTSPGVLVGSAAMVFGSSSALVGVGSLVGSADMVLGSAAALTGAGSLAAEATITVGSTAALGGTGSLTGTVAMAFGASATPFISTASNGLEYTATAHRLHYTAAEQMHFTANGRLHFVATE